MRYSGRSSDQNFISNAHKLSKALLRDGVQASGDPIKVTFNGPFMPFFLRRNEVMVELD
jgi:hypothetical protein